MTDFELYLFYRDADTARTVTRAGLSGLVVDWEWQGKAARQSGADTEINRHTVDDLRAARTTTNQKVLCRINRVGEATPTEIDSALAAGADELLIPMVRAADEVTTVLRHVRERCGVGILVETEEAVSAARALSTLPLSRVYFGLMDFALERGRRPIFEAVLDGTVERVRSHFNVPFGFAGLTLPERGSPLPCALLLAEMTRLECAFSFLRRSFYRDLVGRDPAVEVPRIQAALKTSRARTAAAVEAERRAFVAALQQTLEVLGTGT